VPVIAGADASGIDFEMLERSAISGVVVNARTGGLPIGGVSVLVFDAGGYKVGEAETDASGAWALDAVLLPGQYYLRTSNTRGFIDALYGGAPCPLGSCVVTSGTPVNVTASHATRDLLIALRPGGALQGLVEAPGDRAPLSNVVVTLFDAGGHLLGTTRTSGSGAFAFGGLPPGSYYAAASGAYGYEDQLYDALDCPALSCEIMKGKAIVTSEGLTTELIVVRLAPARPVFDDDPLVPGGTVVRLDHFLQLQTAIATLRGRYGLNAVTWSGAMSRGSVVRAAHLEALRRALDEVYAAAGRAAPVYTALPLIGSHSVITANSITELRAAVVAIW
jgi:hypothetical protein